MLYDTWIYPLRSTELTHINMTSKMTLVLFIETNINLSELVVTLFYSNQRPTFQLGAFEIWNQNEK